MKTQKKIQSLLETFEKKFGYEIKEASQLSQDWFNLKLGVISASNAYKVVAKVGSQGRENYMNELVGQICTGLQKDINTKYTEWGQQHEQAARASYEFQTGKKILEVPFVFKDNSFREGCSPDGLIKVGRKLVGGVEIKCPYASENYISFLTADKIKKEYEWQVQFTMRVLECDSYDFGQYDPRMNVSPLKFITVEKDEKMQKILEDAIPQFLKEMDGKLKKIGIEFGDQWKTLARKYKEMDL